MIDTVQTNISCYPWLPSVHMEIKYTVKGAVCFTTTERQASHPIYFLNKVF